jgi:hypothetical protein
MSSFAVKTIDDLFAEVRLLINDVGVNGTNFRYTNDQIMLKYNTALRELYRYRPDAFIGNFTTGILSNNAVPTYVVGDLGLVPATIFPADDRLFFNAVVFFVVGILELGDDEFTDQGRATSLFASFRQMLGGVGG